MSDLVSDLDLELLVRGGLSGGGASIRQSQSQPSSLSHPFRGGAKGAKGPRLSGGFDDAAGGVVVAVAMGCVAAVVLLYIVRQHTTLPEYVAAAMEKKPGETVSDVMLAKRARKDQKDQNQNDQKERKTTPRDRARDSRKSQNTPRRRVVLKKRAPTSAAWPKEKKPADDAAPRKEAVKAKEKPMVSGGPALMRAAPREEAVKGEEEAVKGEKPMVSSGPAPMRAGSRARVNVLGDIAHVADPKSEFAKKLSKPALPGVPRANDVEGSAKVMSANRNLIEAARAGELRKKLSRATWGVETFRDRKPELPYYSSSKTHILTPEREKFLKDQVAKNTAKIMKSGSVPILFNLPQTFNAPHEGEQPKLGTTLQLEPRA